MRTIRIGLSLLAATATLAALSACSGTGTPTASPTATSTADATTTTATQHATPPTSPSSSATAQGSCGTESAATAVQQAVATLPRPVPNLPDATWDASHADTSGYDSCAALAWSVVSVADGTPSSPNAILLFHDGKYLGTATKVQYPFEPTVTRKSDTSIAVTYRYAKQTDANANPSGTADATFTWDTAAGKVEMAGAVPPASS
ncbi:LppP/LprE lipoprotein [Curtobacterium sp. 9128]|uniref:LppP/LprE family lipoprotein n=1 Tax=Curtobacterium sp. 9128 TaxID=1793722 RepID=UPI0007D7388F|nr:LppP/LprE family lipoprotein [Curtobacterium sp. 9128]SBN64657.1 LppP/LprE lipoprotein [Curtobacterium sp. 9128]